MLQMMLRHLAVLLSCSLRQNDGTSITITAPELTASVPLLAGKHGCHV